MKEREERWQARGMSSQRLRSRRACVQKSGRQGRKPGQELLSHSKDEHTEAWGVEATCLRSHTNFEWHKLKGHPQMDRDVVNGFLGSLSESSLFAAQYPPSLPAQVPSQGLIFPD